jgi:hypothetical protein
MVLAVQTTADHCEIRRWVEEHGDKPASVRENENGDHAGMSRIDFPVGAGEDVLEHISWDDWFEKFEASELAFLYQKEKASGQDSARRPTGDVRVHLGFRRWVARHHA